jgi:hypothetical protein
MSFKPSQGSSIAIVVSLYSTVYCLDVSLHSQGWVCRHHIVASTASYQRTQYQRTLTTTQATLPPPTATPIPAPLHIHHCPPPARQYQQKKRDKYKDTAVQHHAELLPFSVETYGGMAPDAIKLLSAMGAMGEEQLGMWPRHVVIRHLMGSVATSVQRGNAVAWLSGYSRALAAMAGKRRATGIQMEEETQEVEGDVGCAGERE